MNFSEVGARVRSASVALQVDEGRIAWLTEQVAERERLLQDAKAQVSVYDQATMLLNRLGEEQQQAAQAMIEQVVTRGLQSVFEPGLSLVIATSVKGKSTSVEFLIKTEFEDGTVFETSVMDARGGGLVAVVAFLLRVTVLLLTQPVGRRLLLIDESFAHVSVEYQPRVAAFLRELVDETGLQVVMVTHSDEFVEHATSALRFSQSAGRTSAEVLHA